MLVQRRHAHVLEDHRDDEDVVGRQRKLDHVAREELHRGQSPVVHHPVELVDVRSQPQPVVLVEEVDEHPEARGEERHDDREAQRLLDGDDMRFLVQDAEVDREDEEHEGEESAPCPEFWIDGNILGQRVRVRGFIGLRRVQRFGRR
jgi:hypothetical protein